MESIVHSLGQGWLDVKRRHKTGHQYKPYFVVLEQENGTFVLKHYEGGHRAKLIDAIDLRSALGTRKRPAAKGRPHAFEIMLSGMKHQMAAYSSEEVDKWLKRLEDVGVRQIDKPSQDYHVALVDDRGGRKLVSVLKENSPNTGIALRSHMPLILSITDTRVVLRRRENNAEELTSWHVSSMGPLTEREPPPGSNQSTGAASIKLTGIKQGYVGDEVQFCSNDSKEIIQLLRRKVASLMTRNMSNFGVGRLSSIYDSSPSNYSNGRSEIERADPIRSGLATLPRKPPPLPPPVPLPSEDPPYIDYNELASVPPPSPSSSRRSGFAHSMEDLLEWQREEARSTPGQKSSANPYLDLLDGDDYSAACKSARRRSSRPRSSSLDRHVLQRAKTLPGQDESDDGVTCSPPLPPSPLSPPSLPCYASPVFPRKSYQRESGGSRSPLAPGSRPPPLPPPRPAAEHVPSPIAYQQSLDLDRLSYGKARGGAAMFRHKTVDVPPGWYDDHSETKKEEHDYAQIPET